MRKWAGNFECGSLPDQISKDLVKWGQNALARHSVPSPVADEILRELIHVVSFAYIGRKYKLEQTGAGRPLSAPANLLSVDVADLLSKYGVRGNWLNSGWAGNIGLVAEVEAIAQTSLRQAISSANGVTARPARISNARKVLGKVHRS
jgi:hypothetical protein